MPAQELCELHRRQLEAWKAAGTCSMPCSKRTYRRPATELTVVWPLRRAYPFGATKTRRKTWNNRKTFVSPQHTLCSARARNDSRLIAVRCFDLGQLGPLVFDPSVNNADTNGFKYRGVMPAPPVVVQGRSLPRPSEEPRACAATRRVAVPCRATLELGVLPRGP